MTSSGSASTSAAMTAEAVSPEGESNVMPQEFVQLPVVPETSIDVPSMQVINVVEPVHHEIWESINKKG